ncbi:MAG TPA: hypothetical protein VLV85_03680 [Stellaceae bacterium]|nr:hypothetical protein [Stellaceae bacterium]
MRSYGDVRVVECCPMPASPGWLDRLNLAAVVCRRASRYGRRAAYELLDDHLLDDVAIDEDRRLRRSRDREAMFRRVWLAGCGGFL